MNEQLNDFLRKPWVVPAATAVGGLVAGFVGGYFLGKRNGDVFEVVYTDYESPLENTQMELDFTTPLEEVPQPILSPHRDVLGHLTAVEEVDNGIEASGILTDAGVEFLEEHGLVTNPRRNPEDIVIEEQPNEVTRISVFADEEDDWDYEQEEEIRKNAEIYILHSDEFHGEEKGFGQSVLTYYEGDEILVDERDTPIYNHPAIVGDLRFGHGSNDRNVVYIRNEKFKHEYEVVRDPGYYIVEVLGEQIENSISNGDMKHSNRVPKFRME